MFFNGKVVGTDHKDLNADREQLGKRFFAYRAIDGTVRLGRYGKPLKIAQI